MEKNRSSTTAQLAAAARTAQFKERGPIKGSDHLAERFLDPFWRMLVKNRLLLDVARWAYDRQLPGTYPFVLARTLFIDDVFVRELGDGATQVVMLGAGFDSRAYRFASECREQAARVFELDFPATSLAKQAKVNKALGEAAAHVRYVPIDFNTTALSEPLLAAGYDPRARTLFIWEGVTFYLDQAAIDAVLTFVSTQSGSGSAIVFDYLDARILEPACDLWGAEQVRRYVARKGEPFTFGIGADRMNKFLAARGLACEQDLTPSEIERQYLVRPDGSSFGKVAGCYRMALARASGPAVASPAG